MVTWVDAAVRTESPRDRERRKSADWLHTNSIDYHPELDLIVDASASMGIDERKARAAVDIAALVDHLNDNYYKFDK